MTAGPGFLEMAAMLAKLTGRQREYLLDNRLCGLSLTALAKRDGISRGAVGGMIQRAEAKLSVPDRAPEPYVCGTDRSYQNGCRCDSCRRAATMARAQRRQNQRHKLAA